jgi:hypothetical protein
MTTDAAARVNKLDVSAVESWLWDAACQIRGPTFAFPLRITLEYAA